jgi:signal peptidase I
MSLDQRQNAWTAAALSLLFPGLGLLYLNLPLPALLCALVSAYLAFSGIVFAFGHFTLLVVTVASFVLFHLGQAVFAAVMTRSLASTARPFYTHDKLLLIFALFMLFRLETTLTPAVRFLARYLPVEQQDASMKPTLLSGEQCILDKFYYRRFPLQRGSLATVQIPSNPGTWYNVRVIGLPGDTIEVRNGRLYQNGQPESASYPLLTDFSHLSPDNDPFHLRNYGPVRLQDDQIFCLGDNRPDSLDCRAWGPIRTGAVVGRPLYLVWSPVFSRIGRPAG